MMSAENYNNKLQIKKIPSVNNLMDRTLPWGGALLVWIEETTDAMIAPTKSAVCSSTSADISSGRGTSCGWGGDDACRV